MEKWLVYSKKTPNERDNLITNLSIACAIFVIVLGIIIFFLVDKGSTDVADTIRIETPYCKLYYPDKWENQVRIEKNSDGAAYVVEFFGTIGSHKEKKLFKLSFDKESGVIIGYIDNGNGEKISLSIEQEIYDSESLSDWSEDDKLALYSMQDDLNYIIEYLVDLDKFTVKKYEE